MSVELENGDIICPKCEGKSADPESNYKDSSSYHIFVCDTCHGSGKLTWTEKICGKSYKSVFENLAMPLMRTYFPKSLVSNLVSVQPMTSPSNVQYIMKPKTKRKKKGV